jgi:endo-1,4-beta-xylanase
MRLRRLLLTGTAGAAALLAIGTAAGAAQNSGAAASHVTAATTGSAVTSVSAASSGSAADSLRSLAAKVGLRVGTAIIPQDVETPSFAAIASSQFSVVTPGNGMKWGVVEPTEGTFDWTEADQVVAFAQANHQLVRGHTLLWHNQLPTWLTDGVANGTISNAQLASLLHQHITTEVSRYKGKIWQWDVANEFFTDTNPSQINPADFWVSHLGAGIIGQAFVWAHQADPHALLCYNDYNIAGEDGSNAKSDAAYAWLKQELAAGIPISCVGDQGHLDTQFGFSGQRMQQDLVRFAGLGLKVAITEADVRTFVNNATAQVPTDQLSTFAQPEEESQMLQACLAVRQCISFTVWGFTDADSWVPGAFAGEGYATIYDVNQQPKQAYVDMQSDLQLAARGAPQRVPTPMPAA